MHRFFIDSVSGDTALLTDPAQLHHLRDVLRLKTGSAVLLSDVAGNDYAGVITSIDKKQAIMQVVQKRPAPTPHVMLTLACAVPKGSRFDEAIDHLTQLGVTRIVPMLTERVEVKPDAAAAAARLKRWRKIAQSAAQQSRQSKITVIEPLTAFGDVVLNSQEYNLKLIPHLTGERRPLKDFFAASLPRNIIVLIGPEGDFTPEEVALALDNGFVSVSLGDTVLRVATAAIAAASYIRFTINS
ncbi:MAG: RsmE family RNA methyltransferase [Dehalococcoidales bacterium]|jgi:16S rRNA (uracil1498-N3)-methyltransferase